MLSVQHLRENRDTIVAALTKRNKDFSEQIDRVLALDETRRKTQNELDN
ncbi:MAG: serine--tRNA ligase, partial [Flavobacteriales bacterium]